MKLSSLFVQGNQSYIEGSGKELSVSVLEQNLKNGMEEISKKAPGQSVTGEIIEKNGNDILIEIGKNQLLRARLDGNMILENGQQMTFAIKNTGGSKVVLSPLFANTGNNPNITKALQMAGIPENETSVKMVQIMMREGMSIDKNSLSLMMRAVNLNPDADVETLVQLTKLNLPITEDNIFQLEAYKNYHHQLTEGLLTITDSLAETLQEMTSQGDLEGGIALYKEVLSWLGGKETGTVTGEEPLLQEGEVNKTNITEGKETQAASVFSKEEAASFSQQLKNAGFPEEMIKAFSEGKLSGKELLLQISEQLSGEASSGKEMAAASKLLTGKELNKLLKSEMTKQWMLAPEEVGEENKVENLYERLNRQMNRISQTLEQAARGNTPLAKAVANVSGNIDFMNQLNQMFTYVQLPLKLQGKEANGELYVYTNKRNLAEKDGEVSALLHLDMEHLGSVDVHVAMKDHKVATKFYLKDDSTLDFIAARIELLNERLNKRGYSVAASFLKKGDEEPQSIMEEILKQDKKISVLAGYSFDARA